MRSPLWLCVPIVFLAAVLAPVRDHPLQAQARDSAALTGHVTSAEEGAMEGVLVSVKKNGSPVTVTVVTDQQGRYRFPRSRLEPGSYAVRIRAPGYDLSNATSVDVAVDKTTTANLKLQKARDLASQLSNAEWFASIPGTDAQKSSIRGCTHCHTVERMVRTSYGVDKWLSVIERMSTYPQLSFPLKIQKLPAPRVCGGPAS